MLRFIALLSFLAATGCSRSAARPTPAQLVAQILGAPDSANSVWPGFSLLARDLFVYDENGGYLITTKPRPATFSPIADSVAVPRFRERISFKPGPFPGLRANFHSRYEIDGLVVSAVPVWNSPLSSAYHEVFHGFQREHFADSGAGIIDIDGRVSVDYAASVELERRILHRALDSRGARRDSLLRMFLGVRTERQRQDHPDRLNVERRYERWEGLATYVAYTSMSRVQADTSYAMSRIRRDLATPLTQWSSGTGGVIDRLIRTRAYSTGSALGVLLEQTGAEWKQAAQSGQPLEVLLARAINFDSASIATFATLAKNEFRYIDMLASKKPSWGPLADMTEEEFSRLGVFNVSYETDVNIETSWGPGDRGVHRPVPRLVLLPEIETLFEYKRDSYEIRLAGHSVRWDMRGADTTKVLVTFALSESPLLDSRVLERGRTYELDSARLVARNFSMVVSKPVRITVDSNFLRLVFR